LSLGCCFFLIFPFFNFFFLFDFLSPLVFMSLNNFNLQKNFFFFLLLLLMFIHSLNLWSCMLFLLMMLLIWLSFFHPLDFFSHLRFFLVDFPFTWKWPHGRFRNDNESTLPQNHLFCILIGAYAWVTVSLPRPKDHTFGIFPL
jgi:hypothetical protein